MNELRKIILAGSYVVLLAVIGICIFGKNYKSTLVMNSSTGDINLEETIKESTVCELIHNTTSKTKKGPGISPEKVAYITIDDGPSKYTNEILDILDSNGVKATFFMIEGNMRKYKDELKRIADEGHSLGFHSVSHDVKKLYENPQKTLDEFETCNETLKELVDEESKLIRLPYGSKPYMPEDSYKKLYNNGFLIWDWNLDTEDWKSTTDLIVSNVLYYGRENQELVVLMHEKEQSVESLNSVIKILKERGYEILPITEYKTPKNFWRSNLKS